MFIEVVNEESKNHPYGNPDIEIAKVALRTFIKHHPDKLRATIQIAEHQFIIGRVNEITKYAYETISYQTFEAFAWSVPTDGVKPACTTTYEFRTFIDEDAFVASTSPSNQGIRAFTHGEVEHSFNYWRPIEGQTLIEKLVRLLKQEAVIENLVLLAKNKPDAARFEGGHLDCVSEQAVTWLRRTSYDML